MSYEDRWQTTLKLAIKGERVVRWYGHSPFKLPGETEYGEIHNRRSKADNYNQRVLIKRVIAAALAFVILAMSTDIEDYSAGKGLNAVKKVIPIDISYEEYTRIIDLWN